MKLKTETAVCATQHINALLRQSAMKKIADWGEPCADCKYSKECNYDWIARLKPLFEKANIPIQICSPGHSYK